MPGPIVVLPASALGVALALLLDGWADLVLVAGPCLLAGLWLGVRALRQRDTHPAKARGWIVVDGSNVLHWREGVPDLSTVRDVVRRLKRLGYRPAVVFDANVGYRIEDRYLDDSALAARLGLPRKRVIVVPRGTPADPTILKAARDVQGRVLSNDRFRDWSESFPEVRDPGYVLTGGYRTGTLWLEPADRP